MPPPSHPEETRFAVGNDVLDLSDPRCGAKHEDSRFLRRVFAPSERRVILASPDPEATLWLHWAAKEAAFKVVSKGPGGPPPFDHSAFLVALDPTDGGTVRYGALAVPFRRVAVERTDLLHVVALDPRLVRWPGAEGRPALHVGVAVAQEPAWRRGAWEASAGERFTDLERASVHSAASALVRLEARAHLASVLGVAEERLEIVCRGGARGRTPPVALLDAEVAAADVSLSHHGRGVGWALLVW